MAMMRRIYQLWNTPNCNPDYNRGVGVCAGASLTWLVHAINGKPHYNPHETRHLKDTKDVMRSVCHGKLGNGKGTTAERVLWGGTQGAKLSMGRVLDRARSISAEKACEVIATLNGKYAILLGTHVMAVSVSYNKVWLLDNENGLYEGNSVSDLVDTIKELRSSEIGKIRSWCDVIPRPGGQPSKFIPRKEWTWNTTTKVTIVQFR